MKSKNQAPANLQELHAACLAAQPSAQIILCAPFDFGLKAKAAEMLRRSDAAFSAELDAAQAAQDMKAAPRAKASISGLRSGSKRASIKRAWLENSESFNLKPGAMLGKLASLGIESTESSIASMRSDLRACMLAIPLDCFAPAFQAYLAGAKGLRSNDPLAALNRALWDNPSLDRKAAIEMLKNAGYAARDDFIGGSLAASKESISILAEIGAFEKEQQAQAA